MLSRFEDFLRPAKEHLWSLGVGYELRILARTLAELLDELQHLLGMPAPSALIEVYSVWGNGLEFQWQGEDYGATTVEGKIDFPALDQLIERRRPYVASWMYSCDFEDYHVESPSVARQSAERMKSFLPIFVEPNGDAICLDCRTGQIVLDQHDWFDHGSGENGLLMAHDLFEFLDDWRSVCFTRPHSLYWRDALRADGVDWSPAHFSEKFIIPREVRSS